MSDQRRSARVAWLVFGTALTISVVGTLVTIARWRPPPAPAAPRLDVGNVLSSGEGAAADEGFARARAVRPFAFPDDHGPHPEFRSEWWYFTGIVTAGTRPFGYQLTIFRQALAPAARAPARASAWGGRQVYMGHLAVSDVGGGRFLAHERLSREGLGLAGAQGAPTFRVWIEGWEMAGPAAPPGGGPFPLRLSARAGAGGDGDGAGPPVALALTVEAGRGPVLQGDRGLSLKGAEPGNASYYYSHTRMPTSGAITIGGEVFQVQGTSWLDREWSTSALGPELEGWDWLALHLGDGRDLMVYRLRRKDGGASAQSRATVIDAAGRTRVFGPDAFTLAPAGFWTSPASGARYPTRMTLKVPGAGINLALEPMLADQELRMTVRYWEGAVRARGSHEGEGYLELTGYRSGSSPRPRTTP